MKKKYKCMSCCKEVSKPKSFGGVDGHCRPGDLVYNNNDLFAAIENVDNISASVIKEKSEYKDNWFCDNTIHRFIHENFNDIVPLGQLHPENRPEIESLVGTEFYNWKPYRKSGNKIIMRRIGSKFRIGKYIVVEIDNDMANCTAGKVRIIRELTTFEKVILIIKKYYKDILSDIFLPPSKSLRKWSKNSFLSQWYTKATYGVMLMMRIRIENDMY